MLEEFAPLFKYVAKVFVDEKFMDCEFPLGIRMFKIHQQWNEKLQKQIKRESNINPYFTKKNVEGVSWTDPCR